MSTEDNNECHTGNSTSVEKTESKIGVASNVKANGSDKEEPAQSLQTFGSEKDTKTAEKTKKDSKFRKWQKRMRFQPKSVTMETAAEKQGYYKSLAPDSNIELPRAVGVMDFAEEYEKEIKAMEHALKQHGGNKTALQLLPRHMRRRAASHNIKRLPRRLREMATQQAQHSTEDGKEAKVCRRKRRRKVNLQNEYAKRAGKKGWLETHIWHAKRFHMTESSDEHYQDWGCVVAVRPSDKCFRACYRAVAKHCLIQDMSFMKSVEMTGSEDSLTDLLSKTVLDEELVHDDSFRNGDFERQFLIYDKTRKKFAGPVQVMWKPQHGKDDARTLWCWFHPAMFEQVHRVLKELATGAEVTFSDKSSSLIRFRLTGPKSSVTALSVLRPFRAEKKHDDPTVQQNVSQLMTTWLNDNEERVDKQAGTFVQSMKALHLQYFQRKTPSVRLRHGAIIPVIVNDPRLTLPLQKAIPSFKNTEAAITADTSKDSSAEVLSRDSPIWSSSLREQVGASRLPDHVVSTRKSQSKFIDEEERAAYLRSLATPVPTLLVRRTGFQTFTKGSDCKDDDGPTANSLEHRSVHGGPPQGFGSGWDVILPAKWATAFWVSLTYHQARAGGLRELEHTSLECKCAHFPRDFPDTETGARWWKAEENYNHKKYYSKPPAKRVNYSVLGIPFPFAPNWQYLIEADTVAAGPLQTGSGGGAKESTSNNVHVTGVDLPAASLPADSTSTGASESVAAAVKVAGKRVLEDVDQPPTKKTKIDKQTAVDVFVVRDRKKINELTSFIFDKNFGEAISCIERFSSGSQKALICVKVTPINRGTPFPQNILCAPTVDDLKLLESNFEDVLGKGIASCDGPVELAHRDPYKEQRKLASEEAKRRRKKKKKSDEERPTQFQPFHFDVFPSRDIIGYVTSGDFLFSYASGGGLGFVAAHHLASLLRIQSGNTWLCHDFAKHAKMPLALMRNVDSSQYRYVSLLPTTGLA